MSRLVTIATFNHSSEFAVLQSHLDSEGIESFAQNASSGDILNIYGWEASKIKFQVREEDAERAAAIAQNYGLANESDYEDEYGLVGNSFLQKIPIIKNLPKALGFLIVAAVIISAIIIILYFTVLSD